MTAPYQNILGNETEFFLLDAGYKIWLGIKNTGAVIKTYFGLVGLFLAIVVMIVMALATAIVWLPIVLLLWNYVNRMTKNVLQATQLAIKEDFKNVEWETLKTLEYRLGLIIFFLKIGQREIQQFPSVAAKSNADANSVLNSLAIMLDHLKASYHFKSDDPEEQNAWNEFDDIWNYETPELDKKMMFELNKTKS